jgi:aryl-alcohol dehydrogenase-like predicted oxidoreductase
VIGKGGHPASDGLPRLDPAALRADLTSSLKRLNVDAIDLYLVHRDDPSQPVGPIVETLHGFVQERKVRAVGASNWTHDRIAEANDHATRHGLTPLSVSSPHLSLAEQSRPPWPGTVSITGDQATEARAWYRSTQLPVLAWSPLSGGFVAGKDDLGAEQRQAYHTPANLERRRRASRLATTKGITTAQIGLAYTRSLGMRVHPIVFARTAERLRALLDARQVVLTPGEVDWLELRTDSLAENATT